MSNLFNPESVAPDITDEGENRQVETVAKVESQIEKLEYENDALTKMLGKLNKLKNESGTEGDPYKRLKEAISSQLDRN